VSDHQYVDNVHVDDDQRANHVHVDDDQRANHVHDHDDQRANHVHDHDDQRANHVHDHDDQRAKYVHDHDDDSPMPDDDNLDHDIHHVEHLDDVDHVDHDHDPEGAGWVHARLLEEPSRQLGGNRLLAITNPRERVPEHQPLRQRVAHSAPGAPGEGRTTTPRGRPDPPAFCRSRIAELRYPRGRVPADDGADHRCRGRCLGLRIPQHDLGPGRSTGSAEQRGRLPAQLRQFPPTADASGPA
jgi:hypothetical protein